MDPLRLWWMRRQTDKGGVMRQCGHVSRPQHLSEAWEEERDHSGVGLRRGSERWRETGRASVCVWLFHSTPPGDRTSSHFQMVLIILSDDLLERRWPTVAKAWGWFCKLTTDGCCFRWRGGFTNYWFLPQGLFVECSCGIFPPRLVAFFFWGCVVLGSPTCSIVFHVDQRFHSICH